MAATSRLSDIFIDLGDEHVDLERIDAMESLSNGFTITVDVIARLEIDLHPHLGKPCSLRIYEDDEVKRYFHGLLVAGEYHSVANGGHRYRLTLKPWTYFLSQNSDMAIYQDKTPVEIIRLVLEQNGISDSEFKLSKVRDSRVYCVQYRESDFAFISRLMEEEGIYYFFRHEKDRHVMVLCDSPSAHTPGKPASLEYNPQSISVFAADSKERGSGGRSFVQSWTERVSTTGEAKVVIRDYDFKSPDRPLEAELSAELEHPHDVREVYQYPGRYSLESGDRDGQESSGLERSKAMLEGMRAHRRVFIGTSQASSLACGSILTLTKHEVERMNAPYLVTSTYHSIAAESYRSGTMNYEEAFNVRFEAIPAETPFRAPRSTPRPLVEGLESAVVTGPAGEEIYTDEYGRVKVRFHWDRASTPGEKSTCWIRVSQTGGLGNLILPRVGHEVLVDFLAGDPDRPIVVGRVFNKSHMPIYDLPANKTKALWRTKRYGNAGSYAGAKALDTGAPGANEIRFEDKGGSEEMFIHAERDLNTRARFKESHHVGLDQDLMVGRNRQKEVLFDEAAKIGKNRSSEVVLNEKMKVGQQQQLEVGTDRKTKVTVNDTLDVGNTYKLSANNKILLEVGSSKITIDQMGIKIEGMMIKIEGKIMADMTSLKTTTKADVMMTVKGAITMIN